VKIPDFIRLNNLRMRSLFICVASIQVAFLGSVLSDEIGINIPLLRIILGLILISYVPGILILRLLKVHNLSILENLIFAVGLSLANLMFLGFIINFLFPFFGITNPLSLLWIGISTHIEIWFLIMIIYAKRESDHVIGDKISIDIKFQPIFLFIFFPILAILGALIENIYGQNSILMLMIILLGILCPLLLFKKNTRGSNFPLAIFSVSIALLLHNSLITNFIWGWDINHEYYLANLVIQNSYWNSNLYYNTNAMLSIVIIPPIISKLCAISLTWIFKIIVPLWYSLIPVGMFYVFREQLGNKIAFLSSFFIISIFTFYTEMLSLVRQEIASLFLVLIVMLLINRNLTSYNKLFMIIFGISLIISHYGISYIFLFMIISVFLISKFIKTSRISILYEVATKGISNSIRSARFRFLDKKVSLSNKGKSSITLEFIALLFAFAFFWYIYNSGSSTFEAFVGISDHILSSINADLISPAASEGMGIITNSNLPILHEITRLFFFSTIFFTFIGIIHFLIKGCRNLHLEFALFAIVSFIVCVATVFMPIFSNSFGTTRLYFLTQIFLALFFVIGALKFMDRISNLRFKKLKVSRRDQGYRILSIFIGILFILNSGLLFEIASEDPYSISLNKNIDFPRFNSWEEVGSNWLHSQNSGNLKIFSDEYRWLLIGSLEWNNTNRLNKLDPSSYPKSYFYFGTLNVRENMLLIKNQDIGIASREYYDNQKFKYELNNIYSNNGSEIFIN